MGMGFNFPADSGPIMQGTWFNRRTQDSFTVRDAFLEDNQMIILTTDGRRLDYNTIQDYEQVNNPLPPKNGQQSQLPPEVAGMIEDVTAAPVDPSAPVVQNTTDMLPEDMAIITGSQAPANDPLHAPMNQLAGHVAQTPAGRVLTEEEEEAKFTSRTIKRTLDRAKKDPEIAISIKWNKYPEKQMEMLTDYMGIEVEDIVAYYISKIDLDSIRQKLENEIRLFIENKLATVEADSSEEVKKPVSEKSKAKPTKTEKLKK